MDLKGEEMTRKGWEMLVQYQRMGGGMEQNATKWGMGKMLRGRSWVLGNGREMARNAAK